eukprot:10161795-Lingulodinium_polyedra.AAC.1
MATLGFLYGWRHFVAILLLVRRGPNAGATTAPASPRRAGAQSNAPAAHARARGPDRTLPTPS